MRALSPSSWRAYTPAVRAQVFDILLGRRELTSLLLKKLSAGIFGGPVDKTSAYMREEVDRWAAVIKSANIELQ